MNGRSWILSGLLLVGLAGCGKSPMVNGRIVFSRETPDRTTIVETISPMGTDRAVVGTSPPGQSEVGAAMMPLWSPDGQRMSLVSKQVLFVVNADGKGAVPIGPFGESSAEEKDFAWSPDGKWLAFVDNGLLRVVSPDGKRGLVVAVNSTGRVYNVPMGWSADSRELFFYEHGAGNEFRLYGVELEPADFGDWAKVVAQRPLALPPDRRRLLAGWPTHQYQGCRANMAGQQLACELSSGPVQVVSMAEGKVSDFLPDKVNGLPKWSPNGSMVAFSTNDGLWTVGVNAWDNRVKVSPPAREFAWSPDGKWLAVVPQDRSAGIFRIRPNGAEWTMVVKPGSGVRSLSWQPLRRKK
jgi:Tol biopolymer transport system component